MPQEFQRGHTPGMYPIGLAQNLTVLSVVRTVATVSADACRANQVFGAGDRWGSMGCSRGQLAGFDRHSR